MVFLMNNKYKENGDAQRQGSGKCQEKRLKIILRRMREDTSIEVSFMGGDGFWNLMSTTFIGDAKERKGATRLTVK